jgi:hypothetical protein
MELLEHISVFIIILAIVGGIAKALTDWLDNIDREQ